MVQEVQKALADNTVIKEPEIISARIVQEIQQSAALDKVEELKEQLEKLFNLAAGQAQAGLKLVNIDINGAAIQTALNASFTDGAPDNPALLTPLSDLMVKMERIVVLFGNLAKSFNLALSQVTDILEWVNNDSTGVQTVLSTTFPDDAPVNPADVDALLQFVHEIERVLLLFSSLKFKEETVAYLTQNPAVFGIVDLKQRELDDLKGLKFYKELISLGEEAELAVQAVLESYLATSDFSTDDIGRLAGLWKKDASLIESITNNNSIVLPTVPIAALAALFERLTLCHTLGVNAYSLQKLANDVDYTDLVVARDVVLGAFSSKYDDEKVRAEKLEPYQDKINVIKRDALCDYIIAREPELKFKDLPDLYAFFLLDVEMSGCFRTSRVVCANSSLQLYVHRVLMNLERSVSTELVVLSAMLHAVGEEYLEEQKKEWEWRKNYRVWEANRKVFLYPENYLEPDLRDNKTPPFKDLEDELLQKKITLEAAEAAYKKYIAQFAELARLTIAGSYYHDDTDTYYFFGRTQQDPPQYYYRQWVERKFWTPWEKIELAISAPHVSAILFLGKLFLFWVEVNIQEKTKVVNGSSVFDMYEYDVTLNYSYLNENNRWISAQKLEGLYEVPPPPVIVPKENEQIAKQIGEKQKELDQPGGHNDLNDWLVFWQQHLKIVNSANDQDAIDAAEEKVDHYQKEIEKKKNEIATLKNNQEKQMEEQVTNVAKDFKKEYLDSRSFRMCYPSTRTLNGKSFIAIESLWKPPDVEAQAAEPSMNSQWKKVDLFKNALTNSSSVKVSSGDAIRVIAPNGETSLLIWQPHDATTEGYLDY
ncbi:MAG TPA: neuraminidase-like domain-containing protein, partial [Caldilineaceae bacterium]|nr:neuraminidase-like domain-containing protein [Caldilineaceae bacterium]